MLEHLAMIRMIKRESAEQHCVQNDSSAPRIDFRTVIGFVLQDLRCYEVGGAAESLKTLPVSHHVAEAEVGYFYIMIRVEENILEL